MNERKSLISQLKCHDDDDDISHLMMVFITVKHTHTHRIVEILCFFLQINTFVVVRLS